MGLFIVLPSDPGTAAMRRRAEFMTTWWKAESENGLIFWIHGYIHPTEDPLPVGPAVRKRSLNTASTGTRAARAEPSHYGYGLWFYWVQSVILWPCRAGHPALAPRLHLQKWTRSQNVYGRRKEQHELDFRFQVVRHEKILNRNTRPHYGPVARTHWSGRYGAGRPGPHSSSEDCCCWQPLQFKPVCSRLSVPGPPSLAYNRKVPGPWVNWASPE